MKKQPSGESPSPRDELIAMQKKVVARLREEVRKIVGDSSPALDEYRRDYDREVSGYEAEATMEELHGEMRRADIIFAGDYHTLRSSQATVLNLLKVAASFGRPVTLAMELAMASHQQALDKFTAGVISEDELLNMLEYEKNWGFLWRHYSPIFDFARSGKIRIIGINTDAKNADDRLLARDRFSAQVIAEESVLSPDSLIFVMDGDWHAADFHMPAALRDALGGYLAERRMLTIFQNSDAIYWKLAELGIEHRVDVVRVREGAYCLMNAPPLVKLQSFLNWQTDQEEMGAEPLVLGGEGADYTGEVRNMVQTIARFLDISEPGLDSFTVYSSGDVNFLETLIKNRDFTREEIAEIKRQIMQDESYFIQKKNIIYLANLSVNHAAEEAAHFINTVCAGYEDKPRSFEEDFYFRAVKEAVGFTGSKIINPRRQCNREEDFYSFLAMLCAKRELSKREMLEKKVFELVIKHLDAEREYIARGERPGLWPAELYEQTVDVHLGAVHGLGYILGDDWHRALVRGFVSKRDIKDAFYKRFSGAEAKEFYLEWVKKLADFKAEWSSREAHGW
jgi:hypothetical protein